VELGFGFLNLDSDVPSASSKDVVGKCLTSGAFYFDWGFKFTIPLMMAALGLLICLATRVKAHEVGQLSAAGVAIVQVGSFDTDPEAAALQVWRTMLLVLQFGLFPANLNALALFFCRNERQLEQHVLRSDPSIECWNRDHILAVVAAAVVVGTCGVAVPIMLYLKISRSLRDQEGFQRRDQGKHAAELTDEERKVFVAKFERYDANHSGSIDEDELSSILEEQAGMKPSQTEIAEMKAE
jgi:hypothetical protein